MGHVCSQGRVFAKVREDASHRRCRYNRRPVAGLAQW